MTDFFHGWRRKLGVVTLVIACVFAAGWVRSCRIVDTLPISRGNYIYYLQSSGGVLMVASFAGQVKIMHSRVMDLFGIEDHGKKYGFEKERPIDWSFRFIGFGKGGFVPYRIAPESDFKYGRMRIWSVPYWSIVIPLTALSAWLLLSKPRQKPNPQPVQNHA